MSDHNHYVASDNDLLKKQKVYYEFLERIQEIQKHKKSIDIKSLILNSTMRIFRNEKTQWEQYIDRVITEICIRHKLPEHIMKKIHAKLFDQSKSLFAFKDKYPTLCVDDGILMIIHIQKNEFDMAIEIYMRYYDRFGCLYYFAIKYICEQIISYGKNQKIPIQQIQDFYVFINEHYQYK
jgi:hypothetical protein